MTDIKIDIENERAAFEKLNPIPFDVKRAVGTGYISVEFSRKPENSHLYHAKWIGYQQRATLAAEREKWLLAEIARLRDVVEGAAVYHEGYVQKLKDTDPERAKRQQHRADILRGLKQ